MNEGRGDYDDLENMPGKGTGMSEEDGDSSANDHTLPSDSPSATGMAGTPPVSESAGVGARSRRGPSLSLPRVEVSSYTGRPILTLIGAVVALGALAAAGVLFFNGTQPIPQAASNVTNPPVPIEGGGQTVVLPDVTGMSEAEAVQTLKDLGLINVTVVYVTDPNSMGKVAVQSTPGGESARLNENVQLSVGGLQDFTGLQLQEALKKAEDGGHFILVTPATSGEGEPGTVLAQDPAPGSDVPRNETVTFTVNLDGKAVVPNIIGLTEEEAATALGASGLKLGDVTYLVDPVSLGTITGGSAKYLDVIAAGAAVDIVVSAVPNLVGLDIEEAIELIRFNGLEVGEVTVTQPQAGERARAVTAQGPQGGTAVRLRERINITVPLAGESVVPSVLGMPEAEAVAALRTAGLAVGDLTGDRARGRVTVQSQDPQVVIRSGTRINLTFGQSVSSLPDVVGFPEATAVAQLERAGFTVVIKGQEGPAGIVVNQSPKGGSSTARQVTIFVGAG